MQLTPYIEEAKDALGLASETSVHTLRSVPPYYSKEGRHTVERVRATAIAIAEHEVGYDVALREESIGEPEVPV